MDTHLVTHTLNRGERIVENRLLPIARATIVLCVPTRHIHSHSGLLSLKDAENTVSLLIELVNRLDKKTVDGFTAL